MKKFFKDFIMEEDGMGVVEIVIIIAVLVAVALIFKNTLITYSKDLMKNVFEGEGNPTGSEPTSSVYQPPS